MQGVLSYLIFLSQVRISLVKEMFALHEWLVSTITFVELGHTIISNNWGWQAHAWCTKLCIVWEFFIYYTQIIWKPTWITFWFLTGFWWVQNICRFQTDVQIWFFLSDLLPWRDLCRKVVENEEAYVRERAGAWSFPFSVGTKLLLNWKRALQDIFFILFCCIYI